MLIARLQKRGMVSGRFHGQASSLPVVSGPWTYGSGVLNIEKRRTFRPFRPFGPDVRRIAQLPRYDAATGGAGIGGAGAGAAVPETPRRYSSDRLNRLDEAGSWA